MTCKGEELAADYHDATGRLECATVREASHRRAAGRAIERFSCGQDWGLNLEEIWKNSDIYQQYDLGKIHRELQDPSSGVCCSCCGIHRYNWISCCNGRVCFTHRNTNRDVDRHCDGQWGRRQQPRSHCDRDCVHSASRLLYGERDGMDALPLHQGYSKQRAKHLLRAVRDILGPFPGLR